MIQFRKLPDSKPQKCIFCGNPADYLYAYTTEAFDHMVCNAICEKCNPIVKYILGDKTTETFYAKDEAAHYVMQEVINLSCTDLSKYEAFKQVFGMSYEDIDRYIK